MKRSEKLFLLTILTLTSIITCCATTETNTLPKNGITVEKGRKKKEKVYINFEDESLVSIANQFAKLKNINILLPQPTDNIKEKITFIKKDPVSVDEAFDIFQSILDYAGYIVVPQKDHYNVIKNDQNANRSNLRIFINTDHDKLPSSDEHIRYVYTLENIKIHEAKADNQAFGAVLSDLLSQNAMIIFDPKTNNIVFTDRASNIKSAMKIIYELDNTGFREAIEIIPLYYVQASMITNAQKNGILDQLIGGNKNQVGARSVLASKKPSSLYFSSATKVVPDERTNSLIIMGKQDDVKRVKNFILKYIDRPMDDGDSILHVYHLKHLSASTFKSVLSGIIAPPAGSQSKGSALPMFAKHFKNVIITSEAKSAVTKAGTGAKGVTGSHYSGNRLVVAAKKHDWMRIKELIDELDQPQPQIALEVLIVDLETSVSKLIASQTCNKTGLNLPDNVNFQAANLKSIIAPDSTSTDLATSTNALKTNLLTSDITDGAIEGSTVLTLKDAASDGNPMWSVLKMVNASEKTNILSHPFLITKNTNPASITVGESRQIDSGVPAAGSSTINYDTLTANLTVNITPIISKKTKIVNLGIDIEITNFASSSSDGRTKRIIKTNANVRDKEVIVLGGLTKSNDVTGLTPTPILGNIPIFGWLFKKKSKAYTESTLTVFICPTILNGDENERVHQEKLKYAENMFDSANAFDNLRDPITRWFFSNPVKESKEIGNFFTDRFKKSETKPKEKDTKKEKSKPKTKDDTQKPTDEKYGDQLKKLINSELNDNNNLFKKT